MDRFLSTLIVLAHLGVASIPCVETEIRAVRRPASEGRMVHSMPVSAPVEHGPVAGHGGHDHAAAAGAREGHSSHASHAMAEGGSPGDAERRTESARSVGVADGELRAPCLCGCEKRSSTPGTTAPQPPTFAPFPPDPPRLVLAVSPVEGPAPGPWPAPPIEIPDHIPIAA